MPNPPTIDYTKLTPAKLRDLKRRYEEQGYLELAQQCVAELEARGAAKMGDYNHLAWNQLTVREALRPFSELATFEGSGRTNYTEAGAAKVSRKKPAADSAWIDSYAGMSRGKESWVFGCQIKQKGEDPVFTLRDHGVAVETYSADNLPAALERWGTLAEKTKAGV